MNVFRFYYSFRTFTIWENSYNTISFLLFKIPTRPGSSSFWKHLIAATSRNFKRLRLSGDHKLILRYDFAPHNIRKSVQIQAPVITYGTEIEKYWSIDFKRTVHFNCVQSFCHLVRKLEGLFLPVYMFN